MSVLQHLRLTSRLGKFLFIFILISFSSPSHQPCCGWVCVCVVNHLYRYKTSFLCRGPPGFLGGQWPTKTPSGYLCKTYLLLYIFHVVPPLGAFKSQLGGRLVYRCWFILSMSSVVIYIYIGSSHRVNLFCLVFLHDCCIPHHKSIRRLSKSV